VGESHHKMLGHKGVANRRQMATVTVLSTRQLAPRGRDCAPQGPGGSVPVASLAARSGSTR